MELGELQNKILRENCLVAALAEILFNARGEDNIIKLALLHSNVSSKINQAAPIENCGVVSFKVGSIEQAFEALHSHKHDFIG